MRPVFRPGWIVVAVLLGGALWATRDAWSVRPIPLAAPIVVNSAHVRRADTLLRNEIPSQLFARHHIAGAELYALLAAAPDLDPRRIRTGQVFEFRYPVNVDAPDQISLRLGDERVLSLKRDSTGGWLGTSTPIDWTISLELAEGSIRSSLYQTLSDVIPDSILPREERSQLAWDLADRVFGWSIDFTRDVYQGDHFELLFERLSSPLGDVRYGRVVAARIETRGRLNTAYVMPEDDGGNAYYDANGLSLQRSFRRYPVAFRRISSGFSRARYHPVLKQYRAHLGTDYAANPGTEILATGDGVVTRAGRWGGYGIMVEIRHPKGIETRYAHMSGLADGIQPGVAVTQGERIGFVGSTGLATGPHVHYEILKNGRQMNPRALDLGDGKPVPEARRAEFDSVRTSYDRLFGDTPGHAVAVGVD